MSGTRKIYWLCSHPSPAIREKIEILKRFQIETKILHDFPALVRAYAENRLNTIIIDDDMNDKRFSENLQKVCVRPEYAGVRFFLSLSQSHSELVKHAVALGFRDILPLDLPPDLWMRRYVFASAGHVTDLAEPMPQMALRNIAALYIPARVTWLSAEELWLETRLVPPIGAQLNVAGGLANLLGVHHLALKVVEHHQTHLHYRYSDALLCRWDLPKHAQDRKMALHTFIKDQNTLVPYRIFNVVRSQELRRDIVRLLDPKSFHLSVALNKTNMIHEPKYISPDAIVIEDVMCSGSNRTAFKEMLDNLDRKIPIFVVGPGALQDKFQDISKAHQVIPLAQLSAGFPNMLAAQIGEPQKLRDGATFVPKHHKLSFAQVILPARLTHVHPDVAQLALHYPIGRFGIFALETQLFTQSLGRKVHFKVTSGRERQTSSMPDFPYQVDGLLIDLQRQERINLAHALLAYFRDRILQSPFRSKEKGDSEGDKDSEDKPLARSPAKPPRAQHEIPDAEELAPRLEAKPVQADIAISPAAEDLYPKTVIDRAVESLGSFRFTREMKIILVSLILFGLFIYLIVLNAPSEGEQRNVYSDQLQLFQERFGGPKRESTP